MKKYFPFLDWMMSYDKANLSGDLSAGLTVGVMLIPQGMAYSMLAGLPPIYGLYAVTLPLIVYALMGSSRQLAVGPVAMVSLLIASGVGAIATAGSSEYVMYAILLALMVGVLQFSMGVFRLGFLVNFLAHPVIAGFTSAAALIIGFSQFKHLLGVNIPRGKVHETIMAIAEHFSEISYPTLALGVGAILILVFVKKINKKIPAPLIVVLLGMGLVYFLNLEAVGVKILKDVPGGFPAFDIPVIDMGVAKALLPIALTIAFVGFMESIAVAKAIQAKHKDYELDPNQELRALGMANIVGSFFKSFPVTGGFSRTAVNDQAGAKTGLASLVSAVLIIITILFLTEYFYYLPNAILAAIIIVAVYGLIDFKEARHLWKRDKKDFAVFITTFLATLALGIEEGILTGVVLSLALLIHKVSYPHIAQLGKIPDSNEYRNIKRFENLETFSNILIIRFDAQLFFANAKVLNDYILQALEKNNQIQYVIVEATAISSIDSSAIHMIEELNHSLKLKEVELYLSNVKGPIRDQLKLNKLLDDSNKAYYHISTHDAVQAIRKEAGGVDHEVYTLQTG